MSYTADLSHLNLSSFIKTFRAWKIHTQVKLSPFCKKMVTVDAWKHFHLRNGIAFLVHTREIFPLAESIYFQFNAINHQSRRKSERKNNGALTAIPHRRKSKNAGNVCGHITWKIQYLLMLLKLVNGWHCAMNSSRKQWGQRKPSIYRYTYGCQLYDVRDVRSLSSD